MTDNVPTEVRCPHCQGVILRDWVLNVCPQCGRGVSLEELRRAAATVADMLTEGSPPPSEGPLMTSVAAESEPVAASEPPVSDLPFDAEPYSASDAAPSPTRPCVYHPRVQSAQFCPTCGRSYCDDCLVEFRGRKICGECKDAEVAMLQRQSSAQTPLTALIISIIGAAGGAMCCIISACSIVGIIMGYQSLGNIREGKLPRSARPTALAAVTVGWVGVAMLALQALYSVAYFVLLGLSLRTGR